MKKIICVLLSACMLLCLAGCHIEYDLDGAYIWCVIEDGHYQVTSQKNRISVGNENIPPEIVSIPSELTVEQGDLAEIRCVAKSADNSELSFLWFETDTGKLEDIRAVNRGEETNDTLVCDTDNVGTRNYLCMVEPANGGNYFFRKSAEKSLE